MLTSSGLVSRAGGCVLAPVLRWDYARLGDYYCDSLLALTPIQKRVDNLLDAAQSLNLDHEAVCRSIDSCFQDLTTVLHAVAKFHVPAVKKNLYKHWWNDELSDLKLVSIASHRTWLQAGKPKVGPIFLAKQQARLRYRAAIKSKDVDARNVFTNDLMEALQRKNPVSFWKSWRSKVGRDNTPTLVNGLSDPLEVACAFERFFADQGRANISAKSIELEERAITLHSGYVGAFCSPGKLITVEDVSTCAESLKRGKAAGLDGLVVEHVMFAHPVIFTILSKLFRLVLLMSYAPSSFRQSYIVPLVKGVASGKSQSVSDFRGISINSVLSKLFEKTLLRVFKEFFVTSDNQFGFKAGLGCGHAIFAARSIIDNYVNGQSTANMCALDISKAFPSVNHHMLFVKLMQLNVPKCLVDLIISWYTECSSCVKWRGVTSEFFSVMTGVMQGSCLAPILFAIYIDEIIVACNKSQLGYILVYADDMLIIARSITALQELVDLVNFGLTNLALTLNVSKSFCLRIGQRFNIDSKPVVINSCNVAWATCVRYLGVYIMAGKNFGVSHDVAKRNFNRSANAILGRIGTDCDITVLAHLLNSKSLPLLLYGVEASGVRAASLRALDFTFKRYFFKAFRTSSGQVVEDSLSFMGILLPSELIEKRAKKFVEKFQGSGNPFCQHISLVGNFSASVGRCFDVAVWSLYTT
jgi:hypothetical protein